MTSLTAILTMLDPWFIAPYRWPSSAIGGYLLGTVILALQCVLLGDLSALAVAFLNRGHIGKLQQAMDKHHTLSETALRLGDKESYKAVNRQALDAFGHSFSLGAAIFSVSIWPMPFALAWMHLRFADAPLGLPMGVPFLGKTLHYVASFLVLYIAVRLAYSMAMKRIGWYARFKARITGHGV
jgi:hypothetical protein